MRETLDFAARVQGAGFGAAQHLCCSLDSCVLLERPDTLSTSKIWQLVVVLALPSALM